MQSSGALSSLVAEGELILSGLAQLASFEVPNCPPRCAALLVKRFPEPPWNVGLERVDPKGEETMYREARVSEKLLDPWLDLLLRTSVFQERALKALLVASADGPTALFLDLFCQLLRTHLLAATTPRTLVLQAHAYACAVNRGLHRAFGEGRLAVVRSGVAGSQTAGDSGSRVKSEKVNNDELFVPVMSREAWPRLHPAYSHLVAFITTYSSPVPQLQLDCRPLSPVVCEALDVSVLPTLAVVSAQRSVVQVGRKFRQDRRGVKAQMRDGAEFNDVGNASFGVERTIGAVLEGLSHFSRHLEWTLWAFLCFPDKCCQSYARSEALKVALRINLVQPLANDRWVRVHPLMLRHASPAMHAFGKWLERASKERARETISAIPLGLDARGYKRQLKGLVEDTRLSASNGYAAANHAERLTYVSQECSSLGTYLDEEAAMASTTSDEGWWGAGADNYGSATLAIMPLLVPLKLISALLTTAHEELRWLLHHAVSASTNDQDFKLADVISLVSRALSLSYVVQKPLAPWFISASNENMCKVGQIHTVNDSSFGLLLETFPGRTAALIEKDLLTGTDGHLAAVITSLTATKTKSSGSKDKEEMLDNTMAHAASKWSNKMIAFAAESSMTDVIGPLNRIGPDLVTMSKTLSAVDSSSKHNISRLKKSLWRFGTAKKAVEVADCPLNKNSDRIQLRAARCRLAALVATADALAQRPQHQDLALTIRRRLYNIVSSASARLTPQDRFESLCYDKRRGQSNFHNGASIEAMQAAGIKGAPHMGRRVADR